MNANPNTNRVYDLVLLGSTLYVAGSLDSIGGQIRGGLAALDAESGEVLEWDPAVGGANVYEPAEPGIVWSPATDGDQLWAGGLFLWSGAHPVATLVGLSPVPGPVEPPGPTPISIALAGPFPNPATSVTRSGSRCPQAGVVDLAVYDVHGRSVESLLRRQVRPAGVHEVAVPVSTWPPGFYFLRLHANGQAATRKFVVVG